MRYTLYDLVIQMLTRTIEEDSILWNCAAMGNFICG